MSKHKLKNISVEELELEIAKLLTEKLGNNDFKIEINDLKFGFDIKNITEMNLIISEHIDNPLFDSLNSDIDIDEISF